jgi:dienelactone hydrolase
MPIQTKEQAQTVSISVDRVALAGELVRPENARGTVLFAHGSGSSRHSPRNQFVARVLRQWGASTLLFDLLTSQEETEDRLRAHLRFDIELLAERLAAAARWCQANFPKTSLGYFGASTGAAAALVAEARSDTPITAIVSRGGRPDLAGPSLDRVKAPTLLIVGSLDSEVIELNRQAYSRLNCPKELRLIPGAGHLFEQAGTLEMAANAAASWFDQHFPPSAAA